MAPEGKLPKIAIANPVSSQKAETAVPSTILQAETAVSHRNVILHYHLFKNAGTSLDHTLKENFGDGWHEHEGPGPGWRAEDVTEYLRQNPEIVVLSSHTALLPPPELLNATVYPVIFIRHPIDRIRSIYEFERKQIADTLGARMAKEVDLAGYIRWRLQRKGDRTIRNFQAYRLAFAASDAEETKNLSEEERALLAVDSLPFVGLVERFEASLARLQQWLLPSFPFIDFKPIKANVTQKGGLSLEDRLGALRDDLGSELFNDFVHANTLDLKIHEVLTSKIGASC